MSENVNVFAAEPEHGGPGLTEALRINERILTFNGKPSVADGLRSLTGAANWKHIREPGNVDGVFTVSEQQIKKAMKVVIEEFGFAIEPSAAVPVAAVLYSTAFAKRMAALKSGARIGIILTGGNVGIEDLRDIVPDLDTRCLLGKGDVY
jgi:threonine dehydratase